MPVRRRGVTCAIGMLLGGAVTGPSGRALGQSGYPDRPVTIIIPFATGGAPQFLARLVAQRLSQALGQPFVVANHGGEGGMVGTCVAGLAPADGHTLMLTTNSVFGTALHLRPCLFEVADAFAPISLLASTPNVLCIAADSRFRDIADLVAAAQAAPGAIRYGTSLSIHLPVLAFTEAFEITLARVLVNGPGALVETVAGGRADFAFLGLAAALPPVRGGRLRALAVGSAERIPQLPDVPTFAEAGLPGFGMTVDFGLFARAGTPAPILARLSEVCMATMHQPGMGEMLASIGLEVVGGSPAAFATYLEAEGRRWNAILEQHDIRSLQ